MAEILTEFNHTMSDITALKIDCEGCEWKLFSSTPLQHFKQILTEFHFSTNLRFGSMQQRMSPLVRTGLGNHSIVFHHTNVGAKRDQPNIPQYIKKAQLKAAPSMDWKGVQLQRGTIANRSTWCCREFTFLRTDLLVIA
jgi:hypothetical protein